MFGVFVWPFFLWSKFQICSASSNSILGFLILILMYIRASECVLDGMAWMLPLQVLQFDQKNKI
jgi:hypothetical protein